MTNSGESPGDPGLGSTEPKPATKTIVQQQETARKSLPFNNKEDYVNADRGFIGSLEPNIIKNKDGGVVWDNKSYDFLISGDSPNTANPSLWRQSQLARKDGLFEVVPGIYQVRGFDISNTTIVEGAGGIIVIDTLTSKETAEAAFSLYKKHRGSKPVKAIIYTHCHMDHFGGVKGFVSEEDVKSGVKIFAPEGFLEHAISENLYVGAAMGRRAYYMYGALLPRGPQQQIGSGLGQTAPSGTRTLIAPTDTISTTGQEATIDGIKLVFQMAPNTEAPAEMLIYFPDFKALCASEDAVHNFHNILTLRGAVVRDPHGWAKYLTETIGLWGGEAKVLFASHHWPTWGEKEVVEFLTIQRDLYAYVHDQTLRLLNKGYNGAEIAEQIVLPPTLDQTWSCRGYYGSLSHNVKAIYQRYIGWFDGNPAHLWEHSPVERAKRYVELAGGIENVIENGLMAFKAGDFRWAAEVLNHAVFVDPNNKVAKGLLADTYEQLGYGSENATWRNFFISGTTELRSGKFRPPKQEGIDIVRQLTPEMVFDYFAVQINGREAWGKKIAIDVVLTDAAPNNPDRYRWWLSNGALVYTTYSQNNPPDVTITTVTKMVPLLAVLQLDPVKLQEAGVKVTGDANALRSLSKLLDPGDPNFNIVTPKKVFKF